MTAPARTLRSLDDLAAAGLLPAHAGDDAGLRAVAAQYAIALTPAVVAAIDPADPADPVARQYVPTAAEATVTADELDDPIGDEVRSPIKGIVHRYPDRVLLKPLHACPVYCRFCFRRDQVGPGGEALDDAELDAALAYVRERPQIFEVIVTGGDPLMLSPRRLARIVEAVDATPHVAVLRLHSRVPVADPSRIDDALLAALKPRRVALYVGAHVNHANELTDPARAAVARLADAGVPLFSQTVLLRGVNDSVEALETLFRALLAIRVRPYYLHHPDRARGTAHFRLSIAEGQALVRALRGRLSGLAQPTYVLDIPGGHGKSPLGPGYLEPDFEGWSVEDYAGGKHVYRE